MNRRRHRLGSAVTVAALVVAGWQLAPQQLLGNARYATTEGSSMRPMLTAGDLVQVRERDSYKVGDVVLYRNRVLGTTVLHRIIGIDGGRYTFRGDNNDFTDPGTASRSDLLGALQWHVPKAGSAVSFLRAPKHAGWLAAAAVFLLVGSSAVATGRRRSTRTGRTEGAGISRFRSRLGAKRVQRGRSAATDMGDEDVERGFAGVLPWHDPIVDPIQTWLFPALAAILIVSLAAAIAAFSMPTKHTVPKADAYEHSGVFSYEATVNRPSNAYPSGRADTGQTLFLNLFDTATLTFSYRFESTLPHDVTGTMSIRALISAQSQWEQFYPLSAPTELVDGTATSIVPVDIGKLIALLRQLSVASGTVGAEYHIMLQPIVKLTGTVDGTPFTSTFKPVLPFHVTETLLRVDAGSTTDETLPPDITAAPATSRLKSVLEPRQVGELPAVEPRTVSMLGLDMRVAWLRVASVVGMLLAIMGIALGGLYFKAPIPRRYVDRVIRRAGRTIVDVTSIAPVLEHTAAVEVPELTILVELADHYDTELLRDRSGDRDLYAAMGDSMLFTWRDDTGTMERDVDRTLLRARIVEPAKPPTSRTSQTPSRDRTIRAGATLLMIGIVALVPFTYTAASTVPTSYAGVSTHPKQAAQLAPSVCRPLGLVNLVTGASTNVTGTTQNDLLIGRNGSPRVYFGMAGNDCIVAGGGSTVKNTLNGGPGTDICIANPTAKQTTFASCETQL